MLRMIESMLVPTLLRRCQDAVHISKPGSSCRHFSLLFNNRNLNTTIFVSQQTDSGCHIFHEEYACPYHKKVDQRGQHSRYRIMNSQILYVQVSFSCRHDPLLGVASSTVLIAIEGVSSFFAGGSGRIFPSAPRGFLFQPVLFSGPSLNRGKKCASVLMTIVSSGSRSSSENSRQKYFRVSAYRIVSSGLIQVVSSQTSVKIVIHTSQKLSILSFV